MVVELPGGTVTAELSRNHGFVEMTAIGKIYPFFTEQWVWEGVDMLRPFFVQFHRHFGFVIIGDLMKNRENKLGGGICQKWGP